MNFVVVVRGIWLGHPGLLWKYKVCSHILCSWIHNHLFMFTCLTDNWVNGVRNLSPEPSVSWTWNSPHQTGKLLHESEGWVVYRLICLISSPFTFLPIAPDLSISLHFCASSTKICLHIIMVWIGKIRTSILAPCWIPHEKIVVLSVPTDILNLAGEFWKWMKIIHQQCLS